MTYRELQKALNQLRRQGLVPANFKLNQKKNVLEEMYVTVQKKLSGDKAKKVNSRLERQIEVLNTERKAKLAEWEGFSNAQATINQNYDNAIARLRVTHKAVGNLRAKLAA